ncbi:pyridine nucleotide-disulfide oxidoreductase [Lentilactobacillus curieae]|uniref:Pyridine nucleotide-disulfide oxidoreductase n=1 Tax=Lentilactobacillus curieae TaxID=1138822 RepID=A0A1S6QGC9_9LACO|nr:NAD(P)/FAD-dependent oxidoreductase [Lentilactobacillus curieae]AQW20651.1 pyridine nucleotide-disulfide oxidoreductase [Lentilactobacillus curieae]
MNFDVIFIGSGHASWHAAVTLSQAGKKVAIVEEDTIAGTCTSYGCDPKILLDGPFELKNQLRQYPEIIKEDVTIDWNALMNYKKKIINPLPDQLEQLFMAVGITIIKGHGRLSDDHTVSVDNNQYTSENIVIATGEHSRKLNIPGSEFLHDSRDFLSLEAMPHKIVFIGAGIISLEFASMAVELGSEVTIVEYADKALANFNQAYVAKAISKLEKAGVKFDFSTSVDVVEKGTTGLVVKTSRGNQIEADYVLDATGRMPNVEGIGLDGLNIDFSAKGIVTDDHLRTSVPNIYASGDVLDKSVGKLTPTATFESNYIAGQILGDSNPINYAVVPAVVFTLPRIANVGVSSVSALNDDNLVVEKIEYGKQMLFQSKNEVDAEITVVIDRATKTLVGAEAYGNEAADLLNFLTLVINKQISASELNQMIFAFPSTTSGIVSLLVTKMMTI